MCELFVDPACDLRDRFDSGPGDSTVAFFVKM
jgi:hypothetical protein